MIREIDMLMVEELIQGLTVELLNPKLDIVYRSFFVELRAKLQVLLDSKYQSK